MPLPCLQLNSQISEAIYAWCKTRTKVFTKSKKKLASAIISRVATNLNFGGYNLPMLTVHQYIYIISVFFGLIVRHYLQIYPNN